MSAGAGVPLLDLKAQHATIRDEIREALDRVLEEQHFILGPEVEAFERELAAYCQCAHGVGVSSGSDALLVALMALRIRPGDEVIVPSYTFFATAGAVARLGARPVFVDIEPVTYNLDPARLEALITPRTRAIIVVHLYGQMVEMDPVLEVARRHGIKVVEDAAQAIGAEYKGRRAGSLGDLGCFSFFPSKNLGAAGDGGMVTTNDAALADRVKLLRNHGYRPKYYNKEVGGNFRLDAIQAAMLRVKLRHLDAWTQARQKNAATYLRLLAEAGLLIDVPACGRDGCRAAPCSLETTPGVVFPTALPDRRHTYNYFVIRAGKRDALQAHLKQQRVGTEIYYPVPLHLQECFAELEYRAGDLPASECAAKTTLALPIYPELTEAMLAQVVRAIREFGTSG